MTFGWINFINMLAIIWLIVINIIAARKDVSDSFSSKHPAVNIFEQIGRYGCMALMILPIGVRNWEFGFSSVLSFLTWLCLSIALLLVYSILWALKRRGGCVALYGLAIVPVGLFLLNGILLNHLPLIIFALIFGTFHLLVVRENVMPREEL